MSRMTKDHLTGVLNYFEDRLTNAMAEGLNSRVATIQKMAKGFYNEDHFRTSVMFRSGGLQLHPVTHPKHGGPKAPSRVNRPKTFRTRLRTRQPGDAATILSQESSQNGPRQGRQTSQGLRVRSASENRHHWSTGLGPPGSGSPPSGHGKGGRRRTRGWSKSQS